MKDSTQIKIPKWFWVLAVIFLLWNIMGILSFFGHTFITEEALAQLPDNERALYGDYPFWTTIIFAIATFGGLYADKDLYDWFVNEYPNHCKRKLDMGKSCIRFKKTDEIP